MKSLFRRLRTAAATALLVPFLGTAATAQDWAVQVTPYVWATGLGGDIRPTAGSPTVGISKSFSDLLEDLDAAFFLSGYARRGNLVFMGDLSTSSSSRGGALPAPPAPAPLPAEGKLRQTSLTLAAGYRVADAPGGSLDLLVGARHWDLRAEVGVPAVAGLFPGASARRSHAFTDPIVAARANLRLAPDWSMLLYADVGGFGVSSHSTAQVMGVVNYRVAENAFLSAGYRHLQVDYRRGGSRIDMAMGGPILGATWRF